ncbi:hypothetical protein F2Q69_00019591 [Brassica cretica]|uniref:Uncharacterized protein n=1 Tax=Brassica cretica TaxID=69181 RepID=A0A8S9QFG7_BRACR|nr:hypothetical protein F2Q69_00019591 [Brassica cretica]
MKQETRKQMLLYPKKSGSVVHLSGLLFQTLNHAFFQCRVAREVWEISPTSFTVLDQSSNGVIQNINDQWNFK